MTEQAKLEAYLAAFRRRLMQLVVARGVAVLTLAALFLTLAAVYLGIRQAFASELVIGARITLVLVLGLIASVSLIYPLRVLQRTQGIREIERRAPGFDGRIETYQELARTGSSSPFLGLLAEDTLRLARALPISLRVPKWEISAPTALAAVAVMILVGLAAFGPGNWRYGVRHLWAGWALTDTLPPQRIIVAPGDKAVRRGGDLAISAAAEGFDPVAADVFALFDGSDTWESAPMERLDGEEFDFVFFGIRQPLRYYVVAAGVRSAEYAVNVVDLPLVRNIKLTYHYPNWTQLEQEVEDPGSDIRAMEGTDVRLDITTDQSLGEAELIVNGQALTMSIDGNISSATLQVSQDGEYFVSTFFDGDPVRLTDDYLITLIPDNKPVVSLVKPARDWRASSIEEVTVRVEARDDFGLDSLKLHYSVNGGELQERLFDVHGSYMLAEEILYLEEIGTLVPPEPIANAGRGFSFSGPTIDFLQGNNTDEADDSFEVVVENQETSRLQAGDLISYYVEAKDRDQSTRTDLFFVEVQPFDRSFSQSMQGGGGGGGGGQQQDEISQRQKEILVATWNLIREQAEDSTFLDDQQLRDNAAMLSGLQRTLAEQAQTLASRTRARQLTRVDNQIQTFVQNLERAAEAMIPAADWLADLQLEEAVPSEQSALQYLLRAEAVFTDIQVAFNQGGGGGGGGFAGRDLSELFELEMDLEKNQYETEAPVSLDGNDQQPEVDEAIAKLQDLARRQEDLARQANNRQGLSENERWEQDALRRETEELKRQLQQLQRQLQQSAANQPSGQSSGQQQSDQQGTPQGQLTAEVIRQLEAALDAMNRATDESATDVSPQQAQRSVEQARRQLDRALEQMTDQKQVEVAAAFSDLANRSQDLYEQQRQIAAELQQIMRDVLEVQEQNDATQANLNGDESYELAMQKFAMQQSLEELEQDIQSVARRFRSDTPGASRDLTETLTRLQQSQAIAILRDAGEAIQRGAAARVAATHEPITTSALQELQQGTQEAFSLATREVVEGSESEVSPSAVLLEELQALRRELNNLTEEAILGEEIPVGSQGEQTSGSRRGYGGSRPYRGVEDWGTPVQGFQWDERASTQLQDRLREAGGELMTLATRLRARGLGQQEIEAVRLLGDALRRGLEGNPELVEQEFQNMINLIEQLELELSAQSAKDLNSSGVHIEAPGQAAEGFEEVVAEYFRRLSRSESRQ